MILVFGLRILEIGCWGLVLFQKKCYFCALKNGEMAERSNAAVLKTVEGHTSGGSNPSLSAKKELNE